MSSERIAILGPKGTFSEEAALRFNPDLERAAYSSIEEVFDAVRGGAARYGVVPVENSLEGSVSATLELLLKSDIQICREIVLDITHCLMALPGTGIQEIEEVISHPHALAQCRGFLKTLPGVKTRNFPSTAEAAREIASKGLSKTAAIGSRIAADLYGLSILEEGVEDEERNQTRFFVLSKECPEKSGQIKTSIVIAVRDRPGALYEILGYFARGGVNLTKIESRPTKKSLGDYIFYIDFLGDAGDERIRGILEKVAGLTTFFKVLGSYSTG
ncbi:MAG: prephenate dehydratase [Methanobacteriota archaeon]|nr:MAG: prephenate dehydratase [Euryarchaeota archaeon]